METAVKTFGSGSDHNPISLNTYLATVFLLGWALQNSPRFCCFQWDRD